jgi:hypothetical protein
MSWAAKSAIAISPLSPHDSERGSLEVIHKLTLKHCSVIVLSLSCLPNQTVKLEGKRSLMFLCICNTRPIHYSLKNIIEYIL